MSNSNPIGIIITNYTNHTDYTNKKINLTVSLYIIDQFIKKLLIDTHYRIKNLVFGVFKVTEDFKIGIQSTKD